jgi:hypothetical protein
VELIEKLYSATVFRCSWWLAPTAITPFPSLRDKRLRRNNVWARNARTGSHATQFARPEIAIEFDVDSKQAVASRKKIFAAAAKDNLWVAGAHLPFPGIGHMRAETRGYAWVPVEYGPIRSNR